MRKYTLMPIIDFTDKYDETVKYKKGEEIVVEEERALELLSSETPVVRYVSREEIDELVSLKKENEKLKKKIEGKNSKTTKSEDKEN